MVSAVENLPAADGPPSDSPAASSANAPILGFKAPATEAPDTTIANPGAQLPVEPKESPAPAAASGMPEAGYPSADANSQPADATAGSGVAAEAEEVAENTADEEPVDNGPWPTPKALLDRLDGLSWDCETGDWARDTAHWVRMLGPAALEGSEQAAPVLERLDDLGAEADRLAASLQKEGNPLVSKLLRTQHALARRLDIWRRVASLGWPADPAPATEPNSERIEQCAAALEKLLGESPNGQKWLVYLGVQPVKRLAANAEASIDERRTAALAVVQRIHLARMEASLKKLVAAEPFVAWETEMRRWVLGPVNFSVLLRHVEDFERNGRASDGRLLADDCLRLGDSSVEACRRLGSRLETHYRNANVRMAVTADLLNRLIPAREPQYQWVNDEVMGHPVHGQSVTSAEIKVRLIPDSRRLRMALEVSGLVSALTSSTAGPATFTNDSQSTYTAWKELELTMHGVQIRPAEVSVDNYIQLRSVSTNLDPIPILGRVAQNVARSQHEQNIPQASQEMKQKVAARAKQQIDEECDARLTKVTGRLEERMIRPMERMSLGPTAISAETTAERLTTRLRIASGEQLGACTPRPQALGDSLLSFQVHESAVNNVLEQLCLDGQTFTMPELRRQLSDRFSRPEMLQKTSEHDDMTITFAEKDSVRVECRDGRVMLSVSIARMSKPPRVWRDFQAWIYYRPAVKGRTAELVRDGVIQLECPRLSTGSQIAVRGVFSKLFPEDRPLPIAVPLLSDDPRLAQTAITQFLIDDGWIGLAVGPSREPSRARMAQTPGATKQ